jgi:hypothetical protein
MDSILNCAANVTKSSHPIDVLKDHIPLKILT